MRTLSDVTARDAARARAPSRYSLTAAVVIQNEARWLPEWLEYHLLPEIGIGHFYLYDDDSRNRDVVGSTDQLAETIAPYRDQGLLTLHKISSLGPLPNESIPHRSAPKHSRNMPNQLKFQHRAIEFPQQAAMIRHASIHYGYQTRALLFIDVRALSSPASNRVPVPSAPRISP